MKKFQIASSTIRTVLVKNRAIQNRILEPEFKKSVGLEMSFFHGKIRLRELRNCFVNLPSKWTDRNILRPNSYGLIIMKLIFLDDVKCDKFIYVTWNGLKNSTEDSIFLDRCFASKCNIEENELILVQIVDDVNRLSPCISCYLKPVSEDDFQLISMNSEEIESELLNQLRIVTSAFLKDNRFNVVPLWLKSSPNVPIFVKIVKVDPANKTGLIITNQTKITVVSINENIPNEDSKNIKNETKPSSSLKSVFGLFKSLIPNTENLLPPSDSSESSSPIDSSNHNSEHVSMPVYPGEPLLLRIISSEIGTFASQPVAFISTFYFKNLKKRGLEKDYFLAKLKKINHAKGKDTMEDSIQPDTSSLSVEEKFCANFADKFLRISENHAEIYLLVMANEDCPENAIILDRWFIAQHCLSFLSYVSLTGFDQSQTNLPIEKGHSANDIDHLMIPVVKQVKLVSLNMFENDSDSESKVRNNFRKILQETEEKHNFKHLIFWNGFICNVGDQYFLVVHPQMCRQYMETDFTRMLSLCFLLNSSAEVSIQQVGGLKALFSNHIAKLTKNIQAIESRSNVHYEQILSKPFAGREEELNECLQFIRHSLKPSNDTGPLFTTLLIVGAKGSGKTSLVGRILYECWKEYSIWYHTFQCPFIKGKRIESLQKMFGKVLEEAIQHQPSILVFEDLHQITAQNQDDDQKSSEGNSGKNNTNGGTQHLTPESFYYERVAYVFCKLIGTLRRLKSSNHFSRVTILATAESYSKLNNMLIQESNVFDKVLTISHLKTAQRIKVIEEILQKKDFSSPTKQIKTTINFNKKRLAKCTKDFTVQQLNILIDLTLHCSLVSQLSSKSNIFNVIHIIDDAHVHQALSKYRSQFARKTDAKLNTKRLLDDVGGMHKVKELISDLILLQMKHPNLHQCLPLKLPNSLLLYGLPGTGKTTIVEAVANESKLNFISVKGPELLSKYIGNSEQSVRRVFKQAEEMAPCVLFFDEFDSLAPRRGHDSTGVTDRVVNQMLTLMDGLEERKQNIFIMAATSRPDLIDLALLRPGRFDKTVRCDPPNDSERKEIFIALSKNLPINLQSVPFEKLIHSLKNFTGADIQALLYNAFLDANKEFEQNRKSKLEKIVDGRTEDVQTPAISINWKHIEQALNSIKPSLSEQERDRFQRIYQKFETELSGQIWKMDSAKDSDSSSWNKAITLA